jgi:hypothetical protein
MCEKVNRILALNDLKANPDTKNKHALTVKFCLGVVQEGESIPSRLGQRVSSSNNVCVLVSCRESLRPFRDAKSLVDKNVTNNATTDACVIRTLRVIILSYSRFAVVSVWRHNPQRVSGSQVRSLTASPGYPYTTSSSMYWKLVGSKEMNIKSISLFVQRVFGAKSIKQTGTDRSL